MIVEKVNPEEMLLLTSKTFFKSSRLVASVVKKALDDANHTYGDYDSFGKMYQFEHRFDYNGKPNPLWNRWDLYPFFNQMWVDLCRGQHFLQITPRIRCEWKPTEGSYNYHNRILDWNDTYGKDTEVVYYEDELFGDINDGLNGAYKGEYNFCYDHDEWLTIYHITLNGCQDYGGICLWINKYDYSIKLFGIGEDDGFVFPESAYYNDYECLNLYEKNKLLQLVNDIKVDGFDNQKVIEQLWDYPLK